MNVAIIDVGSNNLKLEIHSVKNDGGYDILYADKVAARLGHQVFLTHRLAEENSQIAIEGLRNLAKIIKSFQCKNIIAVGTAALREANSKEFVKRVQKETGIEIEVISGLEEARLVYLGALASIPFHGRTFLLNDIGGGSTEISVSNEYKMLFAESLRLGTVRLKELFFSDSIVAKSRKEKSSHSHIAAMTDYIDKILSPYEKEISKYQIDMGLCTGGTARNLFEIIVESKKKIKYDNGSGIMTTSDLGEVVDLLIRSSESDLQKIPGLDSARTDIIVPGAVLLHRLFQRFNIKESFVSTKGLRDGAIINFIAHKVNKKIIETRQNSYRFYSIEQIHQKFNVEKKHAEHCSFLCMKLFDMFEAIFNLDRSFRDLLYAGALLHDIGSFIGYQEHHTHSQYLIMNSEIMGFSKKEKYLISLIAFHHRKGSARDLSEQNIELNHQERIATMQMSSILRVADGLDRSYTSAVKNIELKSNNSHKIVLYLEGKKDLSLEVWSAEKKKKLFEKTFRRKLEFVT